MWLGISAGQWIVTAAALGSVIGFWVVATQLVDQLTAVLDELRGIRKELQKPSPQPDDSGSIQPPT